MTILYLVVPCYNEEEILEATNLELVRKMEDLIRNNKISTQSRIVYINDGSKDNTWNSIKRLSEESSLVTGLNLGRNRGHQNAVLAGLMFSKEHADITISLDADLQDDIHAIDKMIASFHNGADIVYGVRNNRQKDSFFKRVTAEGYYRFLQFLGVDIVFNHADYRLLSKRALEELERYDEVNLFLRGIVPMIGLPSDYVYYERGERLAGESKYPLKKMLMFAIEGVTSLTMKPIRIISMLGCFTSILSMFYLIYILIQYLRGNVVAGWSSMVASIWLIGGIILFSIGVIGEYVGKIYMETKRRPRFMIEEYIQHENMDEKNNKNE